jgi:Zn ribbon nucleic-acid-binding protein
MSNVLRWFSWTPSLSPFPKGAPPLTDKPTKPTPDGGSVSSVGSSRRASQEMTAEHGGSVSSVSPTAAISRIFLATAQQAQIISEMTDTAPPKPSKPTLPQCIKCDSFALYRNQDGLVECMTCGPNATWRDYPKSSAGSFAMGVREAPEVVHFSTGEGRVQSLGTRPEKP